MHAPLGRALTALFAARQGLLDESEVLGKPLETDHIHTFLKELTFDGFIVSEPFRRFSMAAVHLDPAT